MTQLVTMMFCCLWLIGSCLVATEIYPLPMSKLSRVTAVVAWPVLAIGHAAGVIRENIKANQERR